jgi:hypothetical protein
MKMEVCGQVGPSVLSDGVETQPFRQGRAGEQIIQQLHGRYFEQVLRGNVYSIGCVPTALSAATIALTASGQPIVGIWNPVTSGVNAVILQAMLVDFINNVTSVALGGFVWASSLGNNANMSASLAPFNRKTLASVGSQCRAFSLSTASLLTGLTTTPLVVFEPAEFNTASGLLTTTVSAATPTPSVSGVQNFDGSLIVPPGGILGLFNTVSVTTHTVSARLMWEEVPV